MPAATPTIYDRFRHELERLGYAPVTVSMYTDRVTALVWYYQRLPDTITAAEIRTYLMHLAFERKRGYRHMICTIAAIRAFFQFVLRRSRTSVRAHVPSLGVSREPLNIHSPDEVERILAADGLQTKHRAMLMAAYGAGLRVDEARHLKVADIQSACMRIRVGREGVPQERFVALSPRLLGVLRQYWRTARPCVWLFPSPYNPALPVSFSSLHSTYVRATRMAGLSRRGGIHSLRDSYAVHMLRLGIEPHALQSFLGHDWFLPMTMYVRMARRDASSAKNPLGLLPTGADSVKSGDAP